MFNIDATIGALIKQTKPNDGTLAAIGKLGIDGAAPNFAFDIQTTEDGTNTAWLANGTKLYTVNLETALPPQRATSPAPAARSATSPFCLRCNTDARLQTRAGRHLCRPARLAKKTP